MAYPRVTSFAEVDWNDEAYGLLRRKMKGYYYTFERLAERFTIVGLPETAESLKEKLRKRPMSAPLLLQCLALMDVYDLYDIGFVFDEVLEHQRKIIDATFKRSRNNPITSGRPASPEARAGSVSE